MAVEFEWHIEGPGIKSRTIDREEVRVLLVSVILNAARHYLLASRGWNDRWIRIKDLEEQLDVRVLRSSADTLTVTCSFHDARDDSGEFVEQFLADSLVDLHRVSWAKEPPSEKWTVSRPSSYLEWLVSGLEDHSGGVDGMQFKLSSPHAHQRYEFDRDRILQLSAGLHRMIRGRVSAEYLPSSPVVPILPSSPLHSIFAAITESRPNITGRSEANSTDSETASPVSKLRWAISSGDEAFQEALDAVEIVKLSAEEIVDLLQLAIEAGAYAPARQLSAQGAEVYPDNEKLGKLASVLRVPEFSASPRKGDPSVRANNAWLQEHAEEYRGKWVAIRKGELIAHGATAKEIKTQVRDLSDILITKIAA